MRLATKLNNAFGNLLDEAFKQQFGRECETSYSLMSMALVSAPADGKPFTRPQRDWVAAFSEGYGKALDIARAKP